MRKQELLSNLIASKLTVDEVRTPQFHILPQSWKDRSSKKHIKFRISTILYSMGFTIFKTWDVLWKQHVPTLNLQNVQPPFLRQVPPLCLFFRETSLKIWFFNELQKYSSFLFLSPPYLLKITKLLVKVSQLEFFVMTEKNICVYKLFLSLNISDFNLSFM